MVYCDGYTASDGERKKYACEGYHDRQACISSDDTGVDFKADDEEEKTKPNTGGEGQEGDRACGEDVVRETGNPSERSGTLSPESAYHANRRARGEVIYQVECRPGSLR